MSGIFRFSKATILSLAYVFFALIGAPSNGVASPDKRAIEPQCEENLLKAVASIKLRHSLDQLNFNFDVTEACSQAARFSSSTAFDYLLEVAIEHILTDSRHIESPYSLAILHAFEELGQEVCEPAPLEVIQYADKVLKENLNDARSIIRFMAVTEETPESDSVSDNWILKLKLPKFSDHQFWIVINRKDPKIASIYGFN